MRPRLERLHPRVLAMLEAALWRRPYDQKAAEGRVQLIIQHPRGDYWVIEDVIERGDEGTYPLREALAIASAVRSAYDEQAEILCWYDGVKTEDRRESIQDMVREHIESTVGAN